MEPNQIYRGIFHFLFQVYKVLRPFPVSILDPVDDSDPDEDMHDADEEDLGFTETKTTVLLLFSLFFVTFGCTTKAVSILSS